MMANAWSVYPPYRHWIDTTGATVEPGEPAPCGNIGKTVWYRLDAGSGTEHTISTEGSDFATAIAVYAIDQPSPPGGMTNVSCSTSGTLTFDAATGMSYFVQVGGVESDAGALVVSIDCEVCAVPGGQGGGGGVIVAGGSVAGPDTGSGGYLPGARE